MTGYRDRTRRSEILYERAKNVLPAGVSYGIRALSPHPFYVNNADGITLTDEDGNKYTDYWVGHGALILGHSPKPVVDAVSEQLSKGTHIGFAHEKEIELAERIVKYVPSADMVRYTSSGTEANMYGTRLARAFTGRNKMLKIEGGWHGGYDSLHAYVSRPFGRLESAGLNEKVLEDTFAAPFNDLDMVRKIVNDHELACIVVEPMMGAAGFLPPEPGYLEGLREICDATGTLLIFDEVITGFRLGLSCAQGHYGVTPDLTILGKIVGGGFPIGVFCGKQEVMELIDHNKYPKPERRSAHGGTFTGNPISMVAGMATLDTLADGKIYREIDSRCKRLRAELMDIFSDAPISVTGDGSLFAVHFQKEEPNHAGDLMKSDLKASHEYFKHMLDSGIVYLTPSVCHGFICEPHTNTDMDNFLSASEGFVKSYFSNPHNH
jgi:glutamate-1-semialdehyde 2,1-aminomutase